MGNHFMIFGICWRNTDALKSVYFGCLFDLVWLWKYLNKLILSKSQTFQSIFGLNSTRADIMILLFYLYILVQYNVMT